MENFLAKINLQIIVLSCLIVFITSCVKRYDPQFPVYYKIKNNTSSTIKVVFNDLVNPVYGRYSSKVPDSVIMIGSGDDKALFVSLFSFYYKTNPETSDTLLGMKTLRIYVNDTILSKTYFLLTRYWEYVEPNNNKAELTLTVNTNDFN